MWNTLVDNGPPGRRSCTPTSSKKSSGPCSRCPGTHPEPHVLRRALHRLYASAATVRAPEIHRLATTVEIWWPAIESAILTGHSNARSEGYNRLAKNEGRNTFGFRDPSTNAAGYAGAAPANTGRYQPPPPSSPVKYDESLIGGFSTIMFFPPKQHLVDRHSPTGG